MINKGPAHGLRQPGQAWEGLDVWAGLNWDWDTASSPGSSSGLGGSLQSWDNKVPLHSPRALGGGWALSGSSLYLLSTFHNSYTRVTHPIFLALGSVWISNISHFYGMEGSITKLLFFFFFIFFFFFFLRTEILINFFPLLFRASTFPYIYFKVGKLLTWQLWIKHEILDNVLNSPETNLLQGNL